MCSEHSRVSKSCVWSPRVDFTSSRCIGADEGSSRRSSMCLAIAKRQPAANTGFAQFIMRQTFGFFSRLISALQRAFPRTKWQRPARHTHASVLLIPALFALSLHKFRKENKIKKKFRKWKALKSSFLMKWFELRNWQTKRSIWSGLRLIVIWHISRTRARSTSRRMTQRTYSVNLRSSLVCALSIL